MHLKIEVKYLTLANRCIALDVVDGLFLRPLLWQRLIRRTGEYIKGAQRIEAIDEIVTRRDAERWSDSDVSVAAGTHFKMQNACKQTRATSTQRLAMESFAHRFAFAVQQIALKWKWCSK